MQVGGTGRLRGRKVMVGGGGVVTRHADLVLEVLLVSDGGPSLWRLPQGRQLRGESTAECALREVEERTGLRCELGRELAVAEYLDTRGLSRQTHFWEMDPIGGAVSPLVADQLQWVPLQGADRVVTSPQDVPVIQSLMSLESAPLLV